MAVGTVMGDLLEVTDAPDPTVPDPEDRPFSR
jgi:hypothetical protein